MFWQTSTHTNNIRYAHINISIFSKYTCLSKPTLWRHDDYQDAQWRVKSDQSKHSNETFGCNHVKSSIFTMIGYRYDWQCNIFFWLSLWLTVQHILYLMCMGVFFFSVSLTISIRLSIPFATVSQIFVSVT